MKKFNLQEALEGKSVVTRLGDSVSRLIDFGTDEYFPIYGVVDGTVESWTKEGYYTKGTDSGHDLFMEGE